MSCTTCVGHSTILFSNWYERWLLEEKKNYQFENNQGRVEQTLMHNEQRQRDGARESETNRYKINQKIAIGRQKQKRETCTFYIRFVRATTALTLTRTTTTTAATKMISKFVCLAQKSIWCRYVLFMSLACWKCIHIVIVTTKHQLYRWPELRECTKNWC